MFPFLLANRDFRRLQITNESEHEQHYITNGGGERVQTIGKATNEDEELFYGNNEFRAGRARSHRRLLNHLHKSTGLLIQRG
jgi:hypothetical protein